MTFDDHNFYLNRRRIKTNLTNIGVTTYDENSHKASIILGNGFTKLSGDYSINKVITLGNIYSEDGFDFAKREYVEAKKQGVSYETKYNIKEYTREDFGSDGQYKEYVDSERNSRRSEDGTRNSKPIEKTQFDNEGNKLTQEQADYFKNSKVKDKDGRLILTAHFTGDNFTSFDKTKYGKGAGQVHGNGFCLFLYKNLFRFFPI